MDNHDEKTWKEKLTGIRPQKYFSGLHRELSALGVDISPNGLKKQNDKHGIVKKEEGFFVLRVKTVLALGLWKDMSGNPIVDYSAQGSGLKERFDLAKVREQEAKANIKHREDLQQAGEWIDRRELAGRVLAPAVEFQRAVLSQIDKRVGDWVELVGGDEGKAHALSKELRMFIKEKLALSYASKEYRLSIDPVKPEQKSLIDD